LERKARPGPIKTLGIPRAYAGNGPYKELMSYYNLDAGGITKSVLEFCGK
jgi:transketolase